MSAGDVNVEVSTQKIIVEPATSSVSVIKAGPQGPTGIPGVGTGGAGLPVGGVEGDVLRKDTATDYDVSWGGALPSGFVGATFSSIEPAGWFFDNQTITNCESLYPGLWAGTPTGWRSGSDLVIPDLSGRVLLFTQGTTGATGGAMSVTLDANDLPTHTHAVGTLTTGTTGGTHTHTASTGGSDGTHSHTTTVGNDTHNHAGSANDNYLNDSGTWRFFSSAYGAAGTGHYVGTMNAPYVTVGNDTHNHSVTINTTNSGHGHTTTVNLTNSGHGHTLSGATGDNTTTNTSIDTTPLHITARAMIKI